MAGTFTIGGARPKPAAEIATKEVGVTDNAAEWIVKLLEAEGKSPEEWALRVAVLGGGCSGYRYDIRWDKPNPDDDEVIEHNGARVAVDKRSHALLGGSKVEYFARLQGAGFTIVNPNATSTCGCGESFAM